MPAPHPPEVRSRAIDLARQSRASVGQVAKDLGIGESGLRQRRLSDVVHRQLVADADTEGCQMRALSVLVAIATLYRVQE